MGSGVAVDNAVVVVVVVVVVAVAVVVVTLVTVPVVVVVAVVVVNIVGRVARDTAVGSLVYTVSGRLGIRESIPEEQTTLYLCGFGTPWHWGN